MSHQKAVCKYCAKIAFLAILLPYLVIFNLVHYDLATKLFSPKPASNNDQKNRPKVILLWTSYFWNDWQEMFALNKNSNLWQVDDNSCILTTNRSYLNEASAVVFHSRDINYDNMPSIHNQWQHWVFFLLESLVNSGFFTRQDFLSANRAGFNWLMSYRPDSDIYFPYGKIEKRLTPIDNDERQALSQRIEQFVVDFPKRPSDGVWIVSNCNTISQREVLFDVLVKMGLKLDKFGKCGSSNLPEMEWQKYGIDSFFKRYRFFFAFENSLCDDYVTEKVYASFFHNMKHGLIPVIYGKANYSRLLPPGSYIDVSSMKLPALVHLLKSLSKPDKTSQSLVSSYFQWQYSYSLYYETDRRTKNFKRNSAFKFGWQNLCRKIWTTPLNVTKYIRDVKKEIGGCDEPPAFLPFDEAYANFMNQ